MSSATGDYLHCNTRISNSNISAPTLAVFRGSPENLSFFHVNFLRVFSFSSFAHRGLTVLYVRSSNVM